MEPCPPGLGLPDTSVVGNRTDTPGKEWVLAVGASQGQDASNSLHPDHASRALATQCGPCLSASMALKISLAN